MRVLVTGAAGFIGSGVCSRLLDRGDTVVGIDNLNDYYDVGLKKARLELLETRTGFTFVKQDITDIAGTMSAWEKARPEGVVHLAAQAGVRYSLTHPQVYVDSNITGTLNILEAARKFQVAHLVYASSSSVYGSNERTPFSVHDNVDHPVSLYAATKKSTELMAHTYSHLFGIPTTGLRFFTVYGPWGRPDMSLFLFTRNILVGKPIELFNHGKHRRDFTYIDDIVEGVIRVLDRPAKANPSWDAKNPDPSSSRAPYQVFNIGSHSPVWLDEMVAILEDALGKKASRVGLPIQAGDVVETFADVRSLEAYTGFAPRTPLKTGIERFVRWYREFYRV